MTTILSCNFANKHNHPCTHIRSRIPTHTYAHTYWCYPIEYKNHTYKHTQIFIHLPTYLPTYLHTYIHTHVYTYARRHWRYRVEYKKPEDQIDSGDDMINPDGIYRGEEWRERWEWSDGGFVWRWKGKGSPPDGWIWGVAAPREDDTGGYVKGLRINPRDRAFVVNATRSSTALGGKDYKWVGQESWVWHHAPWKLHRELVPNSGGRWRERYAWVNDTNGQDWVFGGWCRPHSHK
jgi:hypothetical protein